MNWKNFEKSESKFPERIAQEVISGFKEATQELAELAVEQINSMSAWRFNRNITDDYFFKITLKSEYLNDYNFKVLIFSYDVQLNLVKCQLDDKIEKDLGIITCCEGYDHSAGFHLCKTTKFSEFLELVFKSKVFESMVSGLMKIAQKKLIEKFKLNSK